MVTQSEVLHLIVISFEFFDTLHFTDGLITDLYVSDIGLDTNLYRPDASNPPGAPSYGHV